MRELPSSSETDNLTYLLEHFIRNKEEEKKNLTGVLLI